MGPSGGTLPRAVPRLWRPGHAAVQEHNLGFFDSVLDLVLLLNRKGSDLCESPSAIHNPANISPIPGSPSHGLQAHRRAAADVAARDPPAERRPGPCGPSRRHLAPPRPPPPLQRPVGDRRPRVTAGDLLSRAGVAVLYAPGPLHEALGRALLLLHTTPEPCSAAGARAGAVRRTLPADPHRSHGSGIGWETPRHGVGGGEGFRTHSGHPTTISGRTELWNEGRERINISTGAV